MKKRITALTMVLTLALMCVLCAGCKSKTEDGTTGTGVSETEQTETASETVTESEAESESETTNAADMVRYNLESKTDGYEWKRVSRTDCYEGKKFGAENWEYDKSGRLIFNKCVSDSDPQTGEPAYKLSYSYEYDSKGRLLSVVRDDEGYAKSFEKYQYVDNADGTSSAVKDADNERTTLKLDKNGNIIEAERVLTDKENYGKVECRRTCTYDSENHLMTENIYENYDTGEETEIWKYTYNGDLLVKYEFFENGKSISETKFTYDGKHLIKEEYFSEGECTDETRYWYKGDLLIKEEHIFEGKHLYEYEYDSAGRCIKETKICYEEDGCWSWGGVEEYEYDQYGNITKCVYYELLENGEKTYNGSEKYEYQYKADSVTVNRQYFDSDNKLGGSDVTEYRLLPTAWDSSEKYEF